MRIKGVEKAIYVVSIVLRFCVVSGSWHLKRVLTSPQEHRKLHNLSELHAKFRYIQLCRSLRTYGVTFFLVKVSWS